MKDYYIDFKPIRNLLYKLNLWEVLNELNVIKTKRGRTLVPEVIEFIYINSVVYSPEYKNIKIKNKQREWEKLLKRTTDLSNKVGCFWIEKDPWVYLQKNMLNQFKSTSSEYFSHLYRYYYIFSCDIIAKHIETKINMSYKDFFICAMWIHSVFDRKHYCIDKSHFLNECYQNTVFNINNISRTLEILSIPLAEFKLELKNEIRYDENSFITHGYPHIKKPIFEIENRLYCLFPNDLLNQFTSGVYHIAEIFKEKYNLSIPFGSAFEDYVGIILNKNKNLKKSQFRKEIVFNNGQNKTSDWIIKTDDAIVFVECKTKRLQIKSKKNDDIVKSDIDILTEAVTQIYKVYFHYSNNNINELKYNSKLKLIPIVVTLEEWFAGIPNLNEVLTEKVKTRLKEDNLNESIVDVFKFNIISISRFEIEIQKMTKLGFIEYFEMLSNGKLDTEKFKYESYFEHEINQTFLEPLKNQFTE